MKPRRRVVDVTSQDMTLLPETCRRCVFWERGGDRPIDRLLRRDATGTPPSKAAAWREIEGAFGRIGHAVQIDGAVAAYALFGPSGAFAPLRRPIPSPTGDAVLLATLWVRSGSRGHGIGRTLVQSAAREAIRLELQAVEAYGDRRHRDGGCFLPCTWLLHAGFAVEREHPRYPLLRMDVRSIARWAEPIENAVGQAVGRLGLEPEPSPQGAAR